MSTTMLCSTGWLVVPNRFRKALRLALDDKVSFAVEGANRSSQSAPPSHARMGPGKFDRPVLAAPPDAPPMTTARVKTILEDLP